MTMCCSSKRAWLFSFFLAHSYIGMTQENVTGYWQPSFAINYEVTPTYSHNFSIANRNYTFTDEELQLTARQLDLVHFSNVKIKDNQSIALGIQYRFKKVFDGGTNELRLSQQYNIRFNPMVVRYGHRFRSEQRITTVRTVHRFRYRFSVDFPLKGEKLDIGEPYFVGNFENLLSISKELKPQFDSRLTVHLGWKVGEKSKIQLGTEYRIEDYGQSLEHVLFLLSTLNVSL